MDGSILTDTWLSVDVADPAARQQNHGHILSWVVREVRPRLLVQLGNFGGMS